MVHPWVGGGFTSRCGAEEHLLQEPLLLDEKECERPKSDSFESRGFVSPARPTGRSETTARARPGRGGTSRGSRRPGPGVSGRAGPCLRPCDFLRLLAQRSDSGARRSCIIGGMVTVAAGCYMYDTRSPLKKYARGVVSYVLR